MSWNNIIPAFMLEDLVNESNTCRQNAANWHAQQAVKAYRRRQYDTYIRHIRIADQLWRAA